MKTSKTKHSLSLKDILRKAQEEKANVTLFIEGINEKFNGTIKEVNPRRDTVVITCHAGKLSFISLSHICCVTVSEDDIWTSEDDI